MKMTKRKNISLLPTSIQSDELTRFFKSTVDQVFQPGETDQISGYIGRKPSYYDASRDFYKIEPSQERTDSQLEPAVVSLDDTGQVNELVFYQDFVNHLREAGSPVDAMSKLLASTRYSWAPPVDLDKLLNYQHYFWVDDTATPITVHCPSVTYTAVANQLVYALPPLVTEWNGRPDRVMITVNNSPVVSFTIVGANVVLQTAASAGATIVINRYADLVDTLTGMELALNPQTSQHLSSGQRVRIIDGVRDKVYFLEGVGRSIQFVGDIETYTGDRPYIVIDRTDRSRSLWSRRNRWVHRSTLADSDVTSATQASRPIVEFLPNLKLFNYGTFRIIDITCTASTNPIQVATSDVPQHPISVADINGLPLGSVKVDNDHVLIAGDVLLARQHVPLWSAKTFFAQGTVVYFQGHTYRSVDDHVSGSVFTNSHWTADPFESINNQVFVIEEVDDGSSSVYGLLLKTEADIGAVTQLAGTTTEYWFDGISWDVAQPFSKSPLYNLYDNNGVSFEDYAGSSFSGTKIFSYSVGNGADDPYIQAPLKYNEYGQIVFTNYMEVDPILVNGVALDVARFFAVDNNGTPEFENSWHLNVDDTQIFDGTVPFNLQANPDNQVPLEISRNQWFAHFSQVLSGQEGFTGEPYSTNNWKDTERDLSKGRCILQHNASVVRSMVLASRDDFNVIDSIINAKNEYETYIRKFITRFGELYKSGMIPVNATVASIVDATLTNLITTKQSENAFSLSDMAGGQYFIPATPSYLGILPSYVPAIINQDGDSLLQCHDGSLRVLHGDIRDDIMLFLEKKIYDSIPVSFKAEDNGFTLSEYISGYASISIPSQFSRDDLITILGPRFESWAVRRKVNYRTNVYFSSADPFTWNYSSIIDKNGRNFDGHWRGIYRHVYGTDRPHLRPWEILGFGDKPSWWESKYGPMPYTSGNVQMWEDISDGRIIDGPRKGVWPTYAHPDLLPTYVNNVMVTQGYLPVGEGGELLDPIQAHVVPHAPNVLDASKEWKFGDGADFETIWMRTAGYRFDVCIALYLLKPVIFVEKSWDNLDEIEGPNGQPISKATGKRPRLKDTIVHGERVNNALVKIYGLQQWISDYLITNGKSPTLLGLALRKSEVRLAHRVAGFTTQDSLTITADNFGLVPTEDTQIVLRRSASTREEFYSGILVVWTGEAYQVLGFDPTRSFFEVFESDEFGTKYSLNPTQATGKVIKDWKPNVYYSLGALVLHNNIVYSCKLGHTSSRTFENKYWQESNEVSPTSNDTFSVATFTQNVKRVLYGTTFNKKQDVIDFILGYGEFLKSRGWVFELDSENSISDWFSSARSFANWSQFNWADGHFLALSPSARAVTFQSATGTILNVEQTLNGFYGIYDRTGSPIPREISVVERNDNLIRINGGNADIFGARVRIAYIEHALVFNNTTIFGNIIYEPLYNLRQPRLKVNMLRAADWTGRYDAPGYVLINGQIKPSFDKSAESIRTMFDIEASDDPKMRDYARHLLGFQTRDYLTSLNISDTQQFEFYQGLIQNKGSVGAFDRILRSNIVGENRKLEFREEWMVRVGQFGSRFPFNRWEFQIKLDDLRNENQLFNFSSTLSREDWANLNGQTGRWIDTPDGLTGQDFGFTTTRIPSKHALPTAGYVRTNEVTDYALNFADLANKINGALTDFTTINPNPKYWVYDDGLGEWSVQKLRNLSVNNMENRLTSVTVVTTDAFLDVVTIYLDDPHGLTSADVGRYLCFFDVVKTTGFMNGLYQILSIKSDGGIVIDAAIFQGHEFTGIDGDNGARVGILESLRFHSNVERDLFNASFLSAGDLVYVDAPNANGWQVQSYNGSTFTVVRSQGEHVDTDQIISTLAYGLNTRLDRTSINPQPLLLDQIYLIDPKSGKIPGVADREISYKVEFDPASYEVDTGWGKNEVGTVWWDLSTVRFLESNTDDLSRTGITNTEKITEIDYRTKNWVRIAPGTTVDIYEWVRSEIDPNEWVVQNLANPTGTFAGEPYQGFSGPYITRTEYSSTFNVERTYYYFWVKNRLNALNVAGRHLPTIAISNIIGDPSTAGIPWIAPVYDKGFMLSNAGESLHATDTVFQIDFVTNNFDDVVHNQWAIVRVGDDQLLPPARIWTKLVDSVIGFDSNLSALPDATLHPISAVGAAEIPRQNIFAPIDSDIRRGIISARKSFVDMANYILARHNYAETSSTKLEELFVESPLTGRLAWVQPLNSTYIEPIPPATEYDLVVYSIEDRDQLFISRRFASFIGDAPWDTIGWENGPWDADFSIKPRVLVNGIYSSTPFWSVWEFDLSQIPDNASAETMATLIETAIHPVNTYSHIVTSEAARDALPNVENGARVAVYDPESKDFWTIWAYYKNASEKYTMGYNLVNSQRYRISDILLRSDWYAEGYDYTKPPVVRYRTINDRNTTERDDPKSTFVRVDDNGNGKWIWTAYDRVTSQWVVVAQQDGTVQISERTYDYTRPIYGWSPTQGAIFDYVDFKTRDGTFELRLLIRLLVDSGIMSALEMNELFFSMVHFIHSQQDQVDWLLPTSFISVVGYDEPLVASAIAKPDNITTILSYIDEVKPYRVKTRDFVRGLISDSDVQNIRATDFDNPVRWYVESQSNHPLVEGDPLLNTVPWKDWHDNPASNLVRNIEMDITFDRVWPDASLGVNSGAAHFIDQYYVPSDTMPAKNFTDLLNLDFKGTLVDARRVVDNIPRKPDVRIIGSKKIDADVIINGATELKTNFGFADPYLAANRPEELAALKIKDGLVLTIENSWGMGVPRQFITATTPTIIGDNTATTTIVNIPFVAQNKKNVFVYQNGLRIDESRYTLDPFKAQVVAPTKLVDTSAASIIAVRSIGYGSNQSILDQHYFVAGANQTVYSMSVPAGSSVKLDVDGQPHDELIASNTTTTVTLTSAQSTGAKLVFTIMSANGDRLTSHVDTYTYNSSKTWNITTYSPTVPQLHSQVIVELNGRRLTPPKMYYGQFAGAKNRSILLDSAPVSPTSIEVWLNGVLDSSHTSIVDNALVPNSPSFTCADVRVVMRGGEEFDIVNGVLSVPSAVGGDIITVTSFSHDNLMNIKTHTRDGFPTSEYLIYAPLDQNFVWVTVNGQLQVPGFDYAVEAVVDAYDTLPKDYAFYDDVDPRRKFRFFASHSDTDNIVITTFGTNVASPPTVRQLSTKDRSTSLFIGNVANTNAWELNDINAVIHGGALTARLDDNSPTIQVTINPNNLPSDLFDNDPFIAPISNQPGAVWIDGERIEYYSLVKNGLDYTFSQLIRGTHLTSIRSFYPIGTPVANAQKISTNFDRVI
jgi:hypothetical protein